MVNFLSQIFVTKSFPKRGGISEVRNGEIYKHNINTQKGLHRRSISSPRKEQRMSSLIIAVSTITFFFFSSFSPTYEQIRALLRPGRDARNFPWSGTS